MKAKFLGFLLFSAIITFFSALTIAYAFTGPNGDPPNGTGAPLGISFGGTAASTVAEALTNLGAAAIGDNDDITSLGPTDGSDPPLPLDLTLGNVGKYVILNGNVGIGTTSPGSRLQVKALAAGSPPISTVGSNGILNAYLGSYSTDNAGLELRDSSGVAKVLLTADNRNQYINGGGNVGIGVIDPDAKLEVAGQIKITGGTPGAGKVLTSDASGLATWETPTGGISGSGTATRVAFWSGTSTLSSNSNLYWDNTNSRLSIGAGATPTYKLDVASGGATTARFGTAAGDNVIIGGGSGKLDVGTVDPPYTINGKKYATYLPAMTGVKEETAGVIRLRDTNILMDTNDTNNTNIYEYTIDFSKVDEGSDLWLFAKTTNLKNNFGNLSILLTPSFDGNVWYEKDPKNNSVTIFALPRQSASSLRWSAVTYEVSYRLTAPRFDAENWPNRNQTGPEGFIIND